MESGGEVERMANPSAFLQRMEAQSRLRELAEADKDGRLVVLEASDDPSADVAPKED